MWRILATAGRSSQVDSDRKYFGRSKNAEGEGLAEPAVLLMKPTQLDSRKVPIGVNLDFAVPALSPLKAKGAP